jgi:hypothetical protein
MRRARAFRAFAMAAALAAQPAMAQINEADRLARCQNNSEAFTRLRASLGPIWSDQRVAEARAALREMESLDARIAANSSTQTRIQEQAAAGTRNREEANTTLAMLSGYMGEMLRQKQQLGERFGVGCSSTNTLGCDFYMVRNLRTAIEQAVTAQSQRAQIRRQLEMHRTNLIALRCDQASVPVTAGAVIGEAGILNGPWRDSFDNSIISISHNGREVSARRSDGFTYRSRFDGGDRIILTWTQNGSPGSQTGRISYDGNGRAVLIEFGGGTSWVRQ